MQLAELIESSLIKATAIEEIDAAEVMRRIENFSVATIRGLNSPTEVREAKRLLRESFDPANDHAATGETPADLYGGYQKFSVNGGDFRDGAYPQCVRSFYNPIFSDDVFGMREIFRRAAQVRNLLMGVDLDWAINSIDDGFWTASRVHHYPRGGGFMSTHREDYVPRFYEERGLRNAYFQPLVVMSRKGDDADCDYETGGGFFCAGDAKLYYEEVCELGDVLMYDTRVLHGVTEIDLGLPFRQASLDGRFAAFVTLYRDFSER